MATTVTLTIDEDGAPVGRITVEVERGYLRSLAVEPHAQGRGVGTRLVGWAESLLAAEGHSQAVLGVEDDNSRARALYERLGYRPSDGTVTEDGRTCGLLVKPLNEPA